MKIINKKEFLKLPANTVFSDYEPCNFGPLMIKGDNVGNDYSEQQIADAIKCSDSGEFIDLLEKAGKEEISVDMDFDCEYRNGLFEDDGLYAIWEKKDIQALIERLGECL